MNLFWLYGGRMLYRRTAQLYNQPHLIKIILEATQMLSTALTLLGEGERAPYRPTHRRHPCTVWCARRRSNFVRCCRLALALCAEYRRRCPGKVHKCEALLRRMRRSSASHLCTLPGQRRRYSAHSARASRQQRTKLERRRAHQTVHG